jgi:hypothetical protein
MSTELRVIRRGVTLIASMPHDEDLLESLPIGTPIKIVATVHPRNQKAHAWFFGLLGVLSDATDKSIEALLDEIKIGIGHTNKIVMSATGEIKETPRSISWSAMDEPTFKAFRERAVDYIATDIMPGVDREDLVREVHERIAPTENYQRSEAGVAPGPRRATARGGENAGHSSPSVAKQLEKVG